MSGFSFDRKYLTPDEVLRLSQSAYRFRTDGSLSRNSTRDALIIDLMFYHGLRVSELTSLNWSCLDLELGLLTFRHEKSHLKSVHNLTASQIKGFNALLDPSQSLPSCPIFLSQKGSRISRRTVHDLIKRCAKLARLPDWVSCHTLRHSCGFWCADSGMPIRSIAKWLGHKDIRNTMLYTDVQISELPMGDPLLCSFEHTPPSKPLSKRSKRSKKLHPLPSFNFSR